MTRLAIGVAPGARYTGIILRDGDRVLSRQLVARRLDEPTVDWYLGDVVDAVHKAKDLARNHSLQTLNTLGHPAVLAIAEPGTDDPHNPDSVLVEAQIVGAVAGHWVTYRVNPGLARPVRDYPAILQSRGNDRYLRTAWDVAAVALANPAEAAS